MVIFKLLSSSFTEYDVKNEVEIAINLNNFKQILRRIKPNDMLTLELDENKLKITLKGDTKRTFSLPIIELDEREQKIPDLSFNTQIKINSITFNEAVEDADIIAESVLLMAEAEKFMINAEGDLSKASIEIKKSDSTSINTTSTDQIKAKYSIEYLKKMIVASKLCDDVIINFSKDYPLKLEYKVIDKLMMNFILAPRVEND